MIVVLRLNTAAAIKILLKKSCSSDGETRALAK
jgi:hypothetical protein